MPALASLGVAAVGHVGRSGIWNVGAAAAFVGVAATVIAQLLLVLRVWTFNTSAQFTLLAAGLVGIWIAIASWRWGTEGHLNQTQLRVGLAIGVAAILGAVGEVLVVASGSSLTGQALPPAYALVPLVLGGLVYWIGLPLWALWVGRPLGRQ
jgi:hypothetical protein